MAAAPKQQSLTTTPGAAPSFAGRHVLITGASKGIGWVAAQRFAAAGAILSITGRDKDLLAERYVSLTSKFGICCASFAADLTDAGAAAGMVQGAIATQGAIDILINNAGFGASQPFAKMTAEHWDSMLAVNLSSVFHVTRAAIGGMLERGSGRIVNIASTAGVSGYAYVAAYCAAKHGVVGLTRALAHEYAKTGITVNAICPGYVDTDMTAASIDNIVKKTGRSADEVRAELARHNPQGRLIQPEEVADAALWLAGPATASITGQCIVIAGGEIMP